MIYDLFDDLRFIYYLVIVLSDVDDEFLGRHASDGVNLTPQPPTALPPPVRIGLESIFAFHAARVVPAAD